MVKYELGAVNQDDRNVLEFAFARSVGHHAVVDEEISAFAARLGASSPRTREAVDAGRITEERWLFQTAAGRPLDPPPSLQPPRQQAFAAFLDQHSAGRFPASIKAWRKLGRPQPQSYFEEMLLGEMSGSIPRDPMLTALVQSGDIEGQRELLNAFAAARDGDIGQEAAALERGFVAHRKDPWIRAALGSAALELAFELSRRDRAIAARMFDALGPMFAAEAHRRQRLIVRARIGALLDSKHCAEALHDLEPAPFMAVVAKLRVDCYEATGDPLLGTARDDLARMTNWGGRFGSGIELPPVALPLPPGPSDAGGDAPPALDASAE